MSMPSKSASKLSIIGRGFRTFFGRISSIIATIVPGSGSRLNGSGHSGHLGQRRAIRVAALLAPRNRLKVGAGAGIVIVVGAIVSSLVFQDNDSVSLNNAIWLDRTWTFGGIDDARLGELTGTLTDNSIGKAYAYVSTLGIDNRWSGGAQGKGSFMDSREAVSQFVEAFKGTDERMEVMAWVEIWTHLDNIDGYRLDDQNLHQNIADFCRLMVQDLGFDGVLLDVKPLFSDNEDFIRLIRRVRSAVGLEVPIAVAVTADLTPQDLRVQEISSIAPGTMWSPNFKQRVMVSADEVVLLMYQSYRQEPLDYINWVAYHLQTYVNLLETSTNIYVSVPNYGSASSAHNPSIETIAAALDGVVEGLRRLDDEQAKLLSGIAIYSDEQLNQSDWNIFRDKWLQR